MDREHIAEVRAKAVLLYEHIRQWVAAVPLKARVLLALFLVAALLLAIHTALTAKDAGLHLKLQHGFHDAQVSVWVDGDLVYSGRITGSTKKQFGFIPTSSVQGSLSQIIAVRSGQHNVRVRIEPDDATMQEDSISGDIAHNTERELSVSARHNGLSLNWQGIGSADAEAFSSFAWFWRYASSLLLTIAGSIVSALAGYAIRELPARLRSISGSATNPETGPK
jgi:hypothetical protein